MKERRHDRLQRSHNTFKICDSVTYSNPLYNQEPLLNKRTHHLWVEIKFTQKTQMFPQEACC